MNNDTFSIELDQHPPGFTGQGHPAAAWVGVISGNVGEPSEQPLESQFKDGNIQAEDIILSNETQGKEIVEDPNAYGGTAISRKTSTWSIMVDAGPDDTINSASSYANQIIDAIVSSGQSLPGLQGKVWAVP